jgi:hypothetical protein
MAGATALAAGFGAATNIFAAGSSASAARKARADARYRQNQIRALENNRQDIIDPFASIQDLSGMIENPFDNLQVGTRAAEFQASETDLALSTALDTSTTLGFASGGATSVAREAARSKLGIAANIEQQELQNERLRAQGAFEANRLRLGELARVQGARAQGAMFMFNTQEQRDMQRLNRLAGFQQQAQQNAMSGQAGVFSALGSLGGSALSFAANYQAPQTNNSSNITFGNPNFNPLGDFNNATQNSITNSSNIPGLMSQNPGYFTPKFS